MIPIETSIDIAAPPEAVWRVLTDFIHYKDWNPFITDIAGPPAAGASITVQVVVLGGSTLHVPAEITRIEPDRGLTWHSRLLTKGVFDRDHVIDIEPTDTGCTVRNTQTFDGPLAAPAAALGKSVVQHGLQRMNEALKRRVEAAPGTN